MKCEQYELQIALYVENDLPSNEIFSLENHLAKCRACSEFVKEMRAGQQSWKAAASIDFDEAMLRSIRHSVMAEISAQPLTVRERFWGLFNRQMVFASAVIVAISLVALASFIYLQRDNTAPSIVDNGKSNSAIRSEKSNAEKSNSENSNSDVTTKDVLPNDNTKNLADKDQAFNNRFSATNNGMEDKRILQRRNRGNNSSKRTSMDNGVDNDAQANNRSINNDPINSNGTSSDQSLATNRPALNIKDSNEEKLRMEIKTSDPNIRIIWFVGKSNRS